MGDDLRRLTHMAELAVGGGANVQPGQLVVVFGLVEPRYGDRNFKLHDCAGGAWVPLFRDDQLQIGRWLRF